MNQSASPPALAWVIVNHHSAVLQKQDALDKADMGHQFSGLIFSSKKTERVLRGARTPYPILLRLYIIWSHYRISRLTQTSIS